MAVKAAVSAKKPASAPEKKPAAATRPGQQVQERRPAPVPEATGTSSPPSALAARMSEDAGRGVSKASEDNLVSLVYVLQSSSPQVNERNEAYVAGAKPGHLWLRASADPIVDGEEGMLFQPCFFSKDWVEWVPRDAGGGFVARHESLPEDAERLQEDGTNKVRHVMPNGNEVVETRYHMGLVHRDGTAPTPYVIPFSSTGHTVSRQWMFMMNQKQIEGGKTPPSFALLYRLRTKLRSNKAGKWFVIDVQDAGFVQTVEAYEAGRALCAAFEKNALRPEAPVADADRESDETAI